MSDAAELLCPVCSHPPEATIAPRWWFAHRTSAKRGVRCAFLIGCAHIVAVGGAAPIEASAAGEAMARWNAAAESLFATKTARWSDAERAAFRQRLRYPEAEPTKAGTQSRAGAQPTEGTEKTFTSSPTPIFSHV